MDAWVTAAQVKGRPDAEGLSDENAAIVAQVATDVLDDLSGHRFGVTTRTVRPEGCGHRWDAGIYPANVVGWGLAYPPAAAWLGPVLNGGPAGGVGLPCDGCRRWSTGGIDLAGPVAWDSDHPISVLVDGEVLAPSKWAVVDASQLIRLDGGIFPQCQDVRVAPTETGTCAVTYSRGMPVPMAGRQAAISLAVEWAKLYRFVRNAGECKLPQRVQSLSRQGTTVKVLDSLDILRQGGTGLTDVDMWVNAVNPMRTRGRSSVISPDFMDDGPTVQVGSLGGFL